MPAHCFEHTRGHGASRAIVDSGAHSVPMERYALQKSKFDACSCRQTASALPEHALQSSVLRLRSGASKKTCILFGPDKADGRKPSWVETAERGLDLRLGGA